MKKSMSALLISTLCFTACSKNETTNTQRVDIEQDQIIQTKTNQFDVIQENTAQKESQLKYFTGEIDFANLPRGDDENFLASISGWEVAELIKISKDYFIEDPDTSNEIVYEEIQQARKNIVIPELSKHPLIGKSIVFIAKMNPNGDKEVDKDGLYIMESDHRLKPSHLRYDTDTKYLVGDCNDFNGIGYYTKNEYGTETINRSEKYFGDIYNDSYNYEYYGNISSWTESIIKFYKNSIPEIISTPLNVSFKSVYELNPDKSCAFKIEDVELAKKIIDMRDNQKLRYTGEVAYEMMFTDKQLSIIPLYFKGKLINIDDKSILVDNINFDLRKGFEIR